MKALRLFLSTLLLSFLAALPVSAQTVVSLSSNDIAYDAVTQMIYASVPSTGASGRANTVTPINPATGGLGTSIAVGTNPNSLAVSDDGQFLYAGLLGASTIKRITLATQTVGLDISVPSTAYGTMYAGEIKVLPGNPRAIAITRGSYYGVAIFDDNVQRPMSIDSIYVASSIAFASSSSTTLYGYDNYTSGFSFGRFNVNASGLTQIDQTAGLISGYYVRIFGDGGLIYASNGVVVNPQTKTVAGTFAASGSVVPETARNRVYFLTQSGTTVTLRAFNATTYAAVSSVAINGVSGTAGNLIRCGGSRLAFRTSGNQIYIVNNATLVPPALGLAMPASTVEGAGVLTAAGTVSITEAQAANVVVSLASSDTAKITVPSSVTIPQGQLSATFNITVANNSLLEGPRQAVISATATGIVSANRSIQVNDDEQALLNVSLPASTTQGTQFQGTVTLSAPPVNNVAVTLTSNSGLLAVPTSVTILAGQTSGTFSVSTLESEQDIGPQSATITARVTGWSDASASLTILDLPRTASWPTFGNNVGHTGFQATALGNTPYQAGWSISYSTSGLNQVAVGNGMVFATFGSTALSALDASTGTELWRHQFPSSRSVNPPTFDLGRVYVQRGNSSESQFWSFDAATGNTNWSTPFGAQSERYAAPTVLNGGAWVNGGTYGGLYGFNTSDGSQRFFNSSLEQYDEWTPTYHNGVIYTWVAGIFRAHDPVAGVILWSLNLGWNWQGWSMRTVPAAYQGRAFVVGSPNLYAIDLTTHASPWSVAGAFKGSPAVANNAVYALIADKVNAYNAQTGALLGTYSTGSTSIAGQPIVTSDSLIVTSSTATYIFDLQTFALKQTLASGGTASLASGIIFLAGTDGVLRTFYPGGMTTITTALAGSIREGDAPVTGTVSLSQAQPTDTLLNLTSSSPTRIGVPASVTIPANQTTATFQLSAVNDSLLNGPENVTITAKAQSFALRTGSSIIRVLDNEAVTLTLNAPATATEGTIFPVTLSLSGPPTGNISVRISSSDITEAFAPASVVIPAGQTSVVFNVQAVEDGFIDGTQIATLTAHVDGWTDGTDAVSVLDSGSNVTGDWPTFGNGPAHTGYQPITLGARLYQPGWTVSYPASNGLNQVAVAGGRVFVTPYTYYGDTYLSALDASSGGELWRRQFVSSNSINPPTFDSGKVYVQKGKSTTPGNDAQLWCLDAATGNTNWFAPFGAQGERYYAPTVFGGGVWVNGGTYGGLYGFNTSNGSQRFFNSSLPQYDQWTPAYYDGTVYTWVAGVFRAHDPTTGVISWSLTASTGNGSSVNSAPAIDQGRAFVVGSSNFCAIDLTTRAIAWSPGGSFKGSPAVANGAVFGLSGSNVQSYDTQTGALVGTYATGDAAIAGQPIVTNDALIVSSPNKTYVFKLGTFSPIQTIPYGGAASLANGVLYLAGPTGVLRAYNPVIPSTNADLSGLVLSMGTLTPAFDSGVTSYSVSVPTPVRSMTITPTAAQIYASIMVNGTMTVISGSPSGSIALNVGSNLINVVVTAQDGVTTKTYAITVTPESGIGSWRQFYFGNATAYTGDLQDFDHDGVLNIFEFGFGTDPTVRGGAVLQFNGTLAGGGTIGATGQPTTLFAPTAMGVDHRGLFVRRKNFAAAGLTYTPQFSADLGSWMPSTTLPTVLADDGVFQIVSVPYPPFLSGKKVRFFRLQLTIAP